jgi:hypothetical protein
MSLAFSIMIITAFVVWFFVKAIMSGVLFDKDFWLAMRPWLLYIGLPQLVAGVSGRIMQLNDGVVGWIAVGVCTLSTLWLFIVIIIGITGDIEEHKKKH